MWYWTVMFILIAGSIGMLGVSFSSIKKNKAIAAAQTDGSGRRRRRRDEEEEEDAIKSSSPEIPMTSVEVMPALYISVRIV